MRCSRLLVAVMLGVLALAPRAGAHALLRQSDPESGTTLQRPPQAVTLTFTEDPEPSLSSIRVLAASGEQVSRGPAQAVIGRPNTLVVILGAVPTGVYTVAWRTVSRVDGHVTGGSFAFGVGVTPTAASSAQVESLPPSVLGGASRWMLYVGLSTLIGAAWVWTVAFPRAAAGPWHILWLAWAAAALGVIGLEEAQRAAAAVDFVRFMSTSLGRALEWRAIPIVAIAGSFAAVGRLAARGRRSALAIAGGCALVAVLAHVAGGHAAAGSGPGRWANVAVQWLHISAAGAWIGGLAALLAALGRTPDGERTAAVRRFSACAGVLIVIVAATAIERAVDEVGTWGRLVTTPYGQLVLVKAGLLILLAILGAFNRYRSVPAAARSLTSLRRIGTVELATGAVTFMVAAVLTQLAPATFGGGIAGDGSRIVTSGNDFATSVRVRLDINPGFAGSNRFTVSLSDYDTGRPVGAARVSLRFTSSDRPDIGPSLLDLARSPDGTYRAAGSNLSLEGKWIVVVAVERGVNSVEVPLTFAVRGGPLQVRKIEAPGQPTLYAVDLPGGRVLDVYLDPGRAGFNEVHATFIDAAGGELPIPQLATMTVGRPGAPPVALPVRRFGPGHFIGDVTLLSGEWQLEIVATTKGGEVLRRRIPVRLER